MSSAKEKSAINKQKANRDTGARTSIALHAIRRSLFYAFPVVLHFFPKRLNLLADRLPYLVRLQA